MGEVADNSNTLTKKKKKGRPSLLDLQKRALKQQQLLHQNPHQESAAFTNPNSGGRSNLNRRYSNLDQASDDDDERRDKKHRLLHGLNSHDRLDFKSGSCDLDADSINRRKIDGAVHGSDNMEEKASKATDIPQRRFLVDSGPSTPLPDKKLLLFILDRVQKKDTYGVYSDPVDPEELPDYHEIIKNPMDFTTLRKKLESGAYVNLEQFEKDVFLICTNAMEYNSADSIYFRQARAMLELAKKDFENLRQESDGEESVSLSQHQSKVVKRGRPPGTSLKKQPEQSSIDRTTSEISADVAAVTPAGDSSRLSGSYNLRKNPPSYGFRQAETSVRINHNSEYQSGVLIDWEKEFPRSVVKAVNKYGMKNVDENKRDTYKSFQEASVFTMLEDDLKQLTPVGLKIEYGYARSLARYAANLGPVAWRLANRRIETVLPTGTEFGPGWVGENPEAPPENLPQQQILVSGKQKCLNDFASDDHHHSSRIMSPTTSVSSSIIGNKHSSHESKEESAPAARVLKQETESNGLVHGFNGLKEKPNQMVETALSQQGLFPNRKQEFHRLPPDLNARLVSPNSPGSSHQAGSSQHPDLALQL